MTYYAFINIFKKQKNKIIAHETVQNQAMLFSHFFYCVDPDQQSC